MSSRSGTRPLASVVAGVEADAHTAGAIDPGELANMSFLLAFEWTQASPHSVCLNTTFTIPA